MEDNTFGLYSAFLAWSAMVFRSKRQSRLTVATMFLGKKRDMFSILVNQKRQQEYTHCSVGTMPLPGALAAGVAAGVAGVTPLPLTAFAPGCWPFTFPFAPWAPIAMFPSLSEGGVKSPAPPGKEREAGDVKARACCALEGWVVRESIVT